MPHLAPASASLRTSRHLMSGGAVGLAMAALMLSPEARAQVTPPSGTAFQGTPQVVSGNATIVQTPTIDTIRVNSGTAVINWTPDDRNGTGTIDFLPVGRSALFEAGQDFVVLNRIIPVDGNNFPIARLIALNGTITSQISNAAAGITQAGGNVWFYAPGGILVGNNAVINVGGLVLTSRDIDVTGGFFGPNGEIRFRDASIVGANGPVQIAGGAQINARSVVNQAYVAVVAPRIEQAGSVRADGSVALVAAEQADIRMDAGLFDINVIVGTGDPHGIVHTGTTGGPSDTSPAFESRAYLVAVPKSQALTMLVSGTIGFETASSVSIDANGGIVLSAGHNVVGGVVAGQVPGNLGPAGISITDSSFRNNLDATATGTINGRPNQSCQPFCGNGPSGQLLFNGNATLNGAGGVSLSIGQAQQIIVNGNLSLLSANARSGSGGTASLTIDNVSPPSSSSGQGIASITGALLIDASGRGNPATESAAATGGTASLSVNNGFLNAASISVRADATGALGGSTTGGSGTGGTARLTVENGGIVSASGFMRVTADGRGGGGGIDAQQNPTLAFNGGLGAGGNALLTVDNAVLSLGQGLVTLTANGYGAAGSVTSGDGTGGVATLTIDHDGGLTRYNSRQTEVQARGFGGGSGFDPALGIFLATADGGNATGGRATVAISDTLAGTITPGTLIIDAGAQGGVASASTAVTTIVGGDAQSGAARLVMTGTVSNLDVDSIDIAANATGGDAFGLNGVGTGGAGRGFGAVDSTGIALSSGAALRVGSTTAVRADAIGGVGGTQSGRAGGGSAFISLDSGATLESSAVFLSASGVGGGAFDPNQSFTPNTVIGGDANGGIALLQNAGSFSAGVLFVEANAFGGDSNPASSTATGLSGGDAIAGEAVVTHFGGSLTVPNVTLRANGNAGSSGNATGSTGLSRGGTARFSQSLALGQSGGTSLIDNALTIEAFAFARVGGGGAVGTLTGGTAELAIGRNAVMNGTPVILVDASAIHTDANGLVQSTALTRGGNARVTVGGGGTPGVTATLNAQGVEVRANAETVGTTTGTSGNAQGGTAAVAGTSGGTINVAQSLFVEATGRGGTGLRGSQGLGGNASLTAESGVIAIAGSAGIGADGISGESTGNFDAPTATGGTALVTTFGGPTASLTFFDLFAHADGLFSTIPLGLNPATRGRGDALGGTATLDIGDGTTSGTIMRLSANGSAINGGTGTGGTVNFNQMFGGTIDVGGLEISADGFGGTSPEDDDNSDAPFVGGTGRGGTVNIELTAGTTRLDFFNASASGFGGNGFTPVVDPSANPAFAGNGGDGIGGTIDAIIGGDERLLFGEFLIPASTAEFGFAFFGASGRGGNGGDYNAFSGGTVYTPGRGGNGTGGTVSLDLPGGSVSGDVFAAASVRGGDGGRLQSSTAGLTFAGSPNDPRPVGGNATGGTAEIRLAATVSATLSADATASGGEGGMLLASGATGGDAEGGLASIIVDGIDAGSIGISISARAFGGTGGRAFHGVGGDGGNAVGGTTAFDLANGGAADVLNANVDSSGQGGTGRQGIINPNLSAPVGGFRGGNGGNGTGGTIAIGVTDSDLALDSANGGIGLTSVGFGGFGGNGAGAASDGNGGDGIGGTVVLSASGGTLTTASGVAVDISVIGEPGPAGSGGTAGLTQGGIARLEAHDTANGAGLVDLALVSIDASGDRGGRVELIDDTAGPGIRIGNLDISTDGESLTGSDFALTGSGLYISSRNEPIAVDGSLFLSIEGSVLVDAFDSGGFSVAGDFVLSSTLDVVARHEGRGEGVSTIAASGLDFEARSILFQPGTLVTARTGSLSLDALLSIAFGKLAAPQGSMFLTANGDIIGEDGDAGGDIVAEADGEIVVQRLGTTGLGGSSNSSAPNSGSIRLTAGGNVTLGALDAAQDIGIEAANLVQQGSSEIGGNSSLFAGGDIEIDTTGSARFGDATGGFVDVDTGDDLIFGTIDARTGVELEAGADIVGGAIDSAGEIFASSQRASIDIDTSNAEGNILFTAAEGNVIGDFAESRLGSIVIRAISVDFGDLYANSVIDIAADEDVTLDFAATGGEGCGTFGCGEGGNFDVANSLGLTPTGSDILIEAGDTVALGTLDAADSIVIRAGTLTGATSSLTAGKALTATIDNGATFGSLLAGGSIAVTAGGAVTGTSAETTGSGTDLAISGTGGVAMGSIRAGGTTDLLASAGAVTVANLRSVGLIDASGRSVTVAGGTGLLDFQTLRATAGDAAVTVGSGDLTIRSGSASGNLALTTQNGAIETRGLQGGSISIDSSRTVTLNNATTATAALGVTARGAATVNGVAVGGTIRFTSGDIVIASSARIGTGGTTTETLLVNGDGTRRTFVGGTGTTAGYSLSADEMTRVFGGNITIRAPRVSINQGLVASAPGTSVIAPSGDPDLVIDAFTVNGGGSTTGNLGPSGILRIETPGFARVIGAAQVANAAPSNSFVVAADRSLQVILGTGSLRISGGSGLIGSLRLISEDVVVATASAIAEIATASDIAAIDERLAQNDGVVSEEGALSGGTIRFDVGRGLYIQNSGEGDSFSDRRGFTAGAGGVSIFTGDTSSTSGGTTRLVINGRTTSDTGELLTGIDAFTGIAINQTALTGDSQTISGIDPGSTVNGCIIASASNCFTFEIDLVPPIQDNPLVNRFDLESDLTGGDPLDVGTVVELRDRDRMSNEPVVDEPVTGSGNDDLWSPSEGEEGEDEDD